VSRAQGLGGEVFLPASHAPRLGDARPRRSVAVPPLLATRIVPETKHGMTTTELSGVRTNLALFFSGFSLGSSADLFNRALCLRGPGSSTTSRFARLEGCTGLAFVLALGGGGGGCFENPISFTASASSNSSSSALFLAMLACLSSSLRIGSNSGTRHLR
jgi:hypothetical protein